MSNARTLSAAEYTPALARLIAAGYVIECVEFNDIRCKIKVSGMQGQFTWVVDSPYGFGSQGAVNYAANELLENLLPTPSPYVLDYFAQTND